eukprot:CAMPEP_0174382612 /NCGR_PEP_ID=MMETSP0811_2-20130205/124703_1 /TAXON_ID=73025 ORGANISM="Eutreptiella gymnastica-like, Strain CCMP1594" /NCGR_SAMPLE_ID=MMETSP0811_2 /ASSEMBLY_ACC=CAM_ASM_000667 /LENGTH=67 /DNA_ID=CAMNT_0015535961 /DNA_START=829 /DNA_END=1032 /DNA_ORIENTATION=-
MRQNLSGSIQPVEFCPYPPSPELDGPDVLPSAGHTTPPGELRQPQLFFETESLGRIPTLHVHLTLTT